MTYTFKKGDKFQYKEIPIIFEVTNTYPHASSMEIKALVFVPKANQITYYHKKEKK